MVEKFGSLTIFKAENGLIDTYWLITELFLHGFFSFFDFEA